MNKEFKPVKETAINQMEFGNAIVSNIEFQNGKQSQIITIFNNNDFHFEEIKIGIDTAINRIQKDYHNHISSVQTTFNSIKDAKLKTLVTYKKTEFKNTKTVSNENNF